MKSQRIKKLSDTSILILSSSLLVFYYTFALQDFLISSAISCAFFVYILLRMLNRIGKTLPIKELMIMMLSLQLLISPLVTYHVFNNDTEFNMYLGEALYIPFVLTYILFFSLGILLPLFHQKKTSQQLVIPSSSENSKIGLFLIFFGYAALLLSGMVPRSLSFIFYLFSYSRLIGALILIFSTFKYRYYFLFGVYAQFALGIINSAIFYDLIIWGFFLYMALEVKLHSSFLRKIVFTIIGVGGLMFLQSIKSDYRAEVWEEGGNKKESNFESFVAVATNTGNSEVKKKSNFESLITRLNTGWIISAVMLHTPSKAPFSNGKLLLEDLESVLLPRFLAPNKKTVGGKENRDKFTRYTGRGLREGTTMRIGVIADAYINFGYWGGAFLMLLFGVLLNFLISFFNSRFFNTPYYLWLLFIFSFTVRMSDFLVILNSTFKGFIIFLVIRYLTKTFIFNKASNQLNA